MVCVFFKYHFSNSFSLLINTGIFRALNLAIKIAFKHFPHIILIGYSLQPACKIRHLIVLFVYWSLRAMPARLEVVGFWCRTFHVQILTCRWYVRHVHSLAANLYPIGVVHVHSQTFLLHTSSLLSLHRGDELKVVQLHIRCGIHNCFNEPEYSATSREFCLTSGQYLYLIIFMCLGMTTKLLKKVLLEPNRRLHGTKIMF